MSRNGGIEDDHERRLREGDKLLTSSQVAGLYNVDPKTVTRWAKAGKIPAVRTVGGHRRFWRSDIIEHLRNTNGLTPAE